MSRRPGLSGPLARLLACACLPLLGCRSSHLAHESELASYVPPDTVALAVVHFDRLRNSDLQRTLPSAWLSALVPFQEANLAWIAYNGRDLLVIAQGHFSSPPPGALLVTQQLALAGSGVQVRAAMRQHATHQSGAPQLIAQAESVLEQPIGAIIRGDAQLPLSGNGANLNRMLHFTRYVTAAADADSALRIKLTGSCAGPENASHLEESLRALITLATAETRAPGLRSLLKSIQIDREASTVHIHLQADQAALQQLLH